MFVQQAQGEFQVHVSGPYHCGPNHESPKTFEYEVEMHYPRTALDEAGFLLDNISFHEYFTSIRHTELSCERLAQKAAYDLLTLCNKRAYKCRVALVAFSYGTRMARVVHVVRVPYYQRFKSKLKGFYGKN